MNCLPSQVLISSKMMRQLCKARLIHLPSILMTNKNTEENKNAFDPQVLDILACPLSKKPLRYDQMTNELVCDEIGVAYPIVDGIPNLNPIHGRMLNRGVTHTDENKGR